jgi:glycosyltransferase involved in cell wall biosynthesis
MAQDDLASVTVLNRSDTVSVVLPCLNEEGSVGDCVREALQTLAKAGIEGEVIVVDNGSTDRSIEVAERAGARVIVEPVKGYGSALRTGIKAASGTIVVMADADWTYDLTKIPLLVGPVLRGEADIVIGSRLDAATPQSMPILHRYLGTPVLSFLMRRAAGGINLRDGSSGFRAFRRDVILSLGLRGVHFEFMSEMHVRAGQARLRYVEFPTGYRGRIGVSKLSTLADGWSNLKLILMLAPDLLFVIPGAALLTFGALVSGLSFFRPVGLQVGSLRWQPVFFSSIAMTLGLQFVLLGLVVVRRSWLMPRRRRARLAFVADPRFPARAALGGILAMVVGVTIDAVFMFNWFFKNPALSVQLPLASLAQSLLIMGGMTIGFAVGLQSLTWFEPADSPFRSRWGARWVGKPERRRRPRKSG